MAKTQTDRLGSLEIGRFVSALTVVLTHFCGNIPRYGTGGAASHFFASVSLPAPFAAQYFFVLSGFVMMTAHGGDFGKWSAVPHFWWRRACRIYPMYWLALSIVCIFLYAALTPRVAFYMISLVPVPMVEFVSPGWTLRYEMAFYVAFGLCLMPYVGRTLLAFWVLATLWAWRPAALSGFLLCAPTAWFKSVPMAHMSLFFAPFDFFFFAGLAAASIRLPHAKAGAAAIAAGLAVLIIMGPHYKWGYNYGGALTPIPVGLGLGLVMLGLVTLERNGALRLGPFARKLGIMSYPMYVLHVPIMLFVDEFLWSHWHFEGVYLFAFAAAYMATILGIAACAAFLIDRPLQRAFQKIKFLPGGRLRLGTAS